MPDYTIFYTTRGMAPVSDAEAQSVVDYVGWDLIRSMGFGMFSPFWAYGRQYALNIQGIGTPNSQAVVNVFSLADPASVSLVNSGLANMDVIRQEEDNQVRDQAAWWSNLLGSLAGYFQGFGIAVVAGVFLVIAVFVYARTKR